MKSELRQDLVSGDWVIIAPARSLRPHDGFKKPPLRRPAPVKTCPFENPAASGHKPLLLYGTKNDWSLQVVENKFPALTHSRVCATITRHGPFMRAGGVGYHDILITREHKKDFPDLSAAAAFEVMEAFRDRYLMITEDKCIAYISMTHNWGPKAGASVYHSHYQMVALPIVPPDVSHSLAGSARYFKTSKECVHCVMMAWERKEKKRIIYENDGAVALAPYVSRAAYEVRILPKRHLPYFENARDEDFAFMADALRFVLRRFRKNIGDPDYNFFIHTAPVKNKNKYASYHWHIEIIPRLAIRASFELGTGIDINDIDPDMAARQLKNRT